MKTLLLRENLLAFVAIGCLFLTNLSVNAQTVIGFNATSKMCGVI